ncbi:MAG TPA: sigma-70 family RNA polymerase sigma factor [Nocardioidaceae bacterium]|nr:sigma-70 family RNA polymerase sigma factor [Nocardioidaceae bacterium]
MTTPKTPTTPGETEGISGLERYRPELLAHCYRMLGSVHDAEDLVQETYLRAWKSQDTFEGRSSMRTWLYRIATNACLTALQSRGRRPLPTGLGQEASDPFATLVTQPEVPWLEPVPDVLVTDLPDDPAAVVTSRESIRLAFVAALQNLPPRQRAVLVLREVLAWRASEVAEALGTSTAAVNSMLQRARAQIEQAGLSRDDVVEPEEPENRELLDRYVAAFENYDIDAMVSLFTEDAIWEMPPFPGWYQGARTIGDLISTQCPASGPADMRMLPTSANGQPAFALYMRDTDGVHRAFQIQVLTVTDGAVSHVGTFFDTQLFEAFRLPQVYPG